MNSKKNISQIVCWGLTAPPVAVRSSQAASDSTAASRQQTQNDDSASSDPRLVEKAVARGSWFVARCSWFVKTCHYTRMGCGRISQRAASHSCPFWQPSCAFRWSAPDGPKRLSGRPLRTGPWAVYFLRPADHALFSSPGCDTVGAVPTGGPPESCAYPEFMTDGAWS